MDFFDCFFHLAMKFDIVDFILNFIWLKSASLMNSYLHILIANSAAKDTVSLQRSKRLKWVNQ